MHYIKNELHPRVWIITYQREEKTIGLMLSVTEALDLLYRADITQANNQDTADTFEDAMCTVASVRSPLGPEEEPEECTYKISAAEVIGNLSEEEIMRIVLHHEVALNVARLGYTGALESYRKELHTIRRKLEENTRKLRAFTRMTPAECAPTRQVKGGAL